jgi:hypothetical protein
MATITLSLALACSSGEPGTATPSLTSGQNPFSAHLLAPDEQRWIDGQVEERLDAGSYVYLRLRPVEQPAVWVASLAMTTPAQPLVRVLVLGRAERFESRRLARVFSPLLFGVIRAANQDPALISKGIEP